MGFGMGFCCCDSSFVLLVATHGRYDTGGGVYSTVTAWDGSGNTLATPPASSLWKYDLGLTAAGNAWVPGHPLIDPDGNVYVPYIGRTQASPKLNGGGLLKLDSSGGLLWNYATGTQTHSGLDPGHGFNTIPRCRIMSNGNIVFSHVLTDTGSYFLTILDPSGSVVTQIVRPSSGTAGTTVNVGDNFPAWAMDLDSSDNIYVQANIANPNALKLNSSGTYVATISVSNSSVVGMIIDQATGKMFTNAGSSFSSGSTIFCRQIDLATATLDWSLTLTNVDGSATPGSSSDNCYSLALSPDGLHVYHGGFLIQSPSTLRSSLQDIKANVSSGSKGVWGTLASSLTGVSGITCDPVTGDRFAYKNAGSGNRILKFYINGFGNLDDLWIFFNPTGTSSTNGVMGLAARSI